jgi:transcriptional regulator with XRE-family HTH domain
MAADVDRVPQKQLNTFCRNLRRLRQRAGLTQERLAERAGVSSRYLQSIEAGSFGCSLAVLIRLRAALNVSWDALLRGVK